MCPSWQPKELPNLKTSDYKETSKSTISYNCLAWAAEEPKRRWDPNSYYWPLGVPREITKEAFISAFATKGYEVCADPYPELGFQKIAIYFDKEGDPTHAARQLENGLWTSKLGDYEDVEHKTLECMKDYGEAAVYMRRPRQGPDHPPVS
jgi:hypothetical protein